MARGYMPGGGGGGSGSDECTATQSKLLADGTTAILQGSNDEPVSGTLPLGVVLTTYGGTIPTKSASDLSASGKTVTVPGGYYASQVTKDVATGSATTPATTKQQSTPSISVNGSGLITASVAATSVSVTPSVSAGYVSSGTAGTVTMSANSNTYQMSTKGATTISPSTSAQTAVAAGVYTTGAITVAAMPSGALGTVSASKSISGNTATITPSISGGTAGYISATSKSGSAVTVSASELVSGSETKTANGTYNVTNLASLVVAIPVFSW